MIQGHTSSYKETANVPILGIYHCLFADLTLEKLKKAD